MDCGGTRGPELRPEIGFRAQSGQDVVDVLVSFESDAWFCWLNGQPVVHLASGLGCAREDLLRIVVSTFPDEKAFNQYWRAG
jgi:hypothetical protein